MHEENGQADVEQDDHADHDGVWALKNTQDMRSVRSIICCRPEMPGGTFPKSIGVYFTYPSCTRRKRLERGGPLKKELGGRLDEAG